jgi:hypothetical protein
MKLAQSEIQTSREEVGFENCIRERTGFVLEKN